MSKRLGRADMRTETLIAETAKACPLKIIRIARPITIMSTSANRVDRITELTIIFANGDIGLCDVKL